MIKPTQKTTTKTEKSEPTKPADDAPLAPKAEPSSPTAPAIEAPKDIAADVATLSDENLNAMLKVLRTEARRREKERESLRPKVGSKVRILKGRPKYVGKEGTAVIVRKSRCFVTVPGINAPAYVLITDVELIER